MQASFRLIKTCTCYLFVLSFSDDYDKLNVTDGVEPVSFEIREPDGHVISSSIRLGDPLDLVFYLNSPGGARFRYAQHKF